MKRFSLILVLEVATICAPQLFAATVSTLADSGSGSLREAVSAGGTVDFAVTGTITLTSGELVINGPLTIIGPGAALLTVQRSTAAGTPEFRVLRVQGGSVTISGLTIPACTSFSISASRAGCSVCLADAEPLSKRSKTFEPDLRISNTAIR